MIRKLYPEGKTKAFSLSYDDGVEQDVRLVKLLNQYGLKGTFNLNSGLMLQEFTWTHDSRMEVKRLPESTVVELYRGHEVASHTFSHPYLDNLSEWEIMKEMAADKYLLERLIGAEVAGFAAPFTYYSEVIARCAKRCGFTYARISEVTGNYKIPKDHYFWKGGKFHWDEDLEEFIDEFLRTDEELALCQIVGHSYDLDVMDNWDRIEAIFRRISYCDDVAAMTNLEIVRYLQAMDVAEITDGYIRNNSKVNLWFRVDGKDFVLEPSEKYIRKD